MINNSGATCLIVGLGAPKQEIWIDRHRSRMPGVKVYMGVGATIDYEAQAVRRAPAWMTRNGLEWVYRMTTEPRRYWRRYTRTLEFFWLVCSIARPLPAAILYLGGSRWGRPPGRQRSTGADVERIFFGDNQFFGDQPFLGGKGAPAGDQIPGRRRDPRRAAIGAQRGRHRLHVHDPRWWRRSRKRSVRIRRTGRVPLLSRHALRPQICERSDRTRLYGALKKFMPSGGMIETLTRGIAGSALARTSMRS